MRYLNLFVGLLLLSFSSFAQNQNNELQAKVINASEQVPTIDEVKAGDFDFVYMLDGKQINATLVSATVIHLPATGEIQAPVSCSQNNKWKSVKNYLSSLSINPGDFVVIEELKVVSDGKNYQIKELRLNF